MSTIVQNAPKHVSNNKGPRLAKVFDYNDNNGSASSGGWAYSYKRNISTKENNHKKCHKISDFK